MENHRARVLGKSDGCSRLLYSKISHSKKNSRLWCRLWRNDSGSATPWLSGHRTGANQRWVPQGPAVTISIWCRRCCRGHRALAQCLGRTLAYWESPRTQRYYSFLDRPDQSIYRIARSAKYFETWWHKDDPTHLSFFCNRTLGVMADLRDYTIDIYGD